MSAGSFCRSASIVTTIRPRAALKPASVAAVSPALALRLTSRTRVSPSRSRRTISALLSWLPSSTKTTSKSRPRPSSTGRSSAHSGARFSSSLYTGMTTERSSTNAPVSLGSPRLAQQRLDVQERLALVEQAKAVDLADPAGAVDQVEPRRMVRLAAGEPFRPLLLACQHRAQALGLGTQEAPAAGAGRGGWSVAGEHAGLDNHRVYVGG